MAAQRLQDAASLLAGSALSSTDAQPAAPGQNSRTLEPPSTLPHNFKTFDGQKQIVQL